MAKKQLFQIKDYFMTLNELDRKNYLSKKIYQNKESNEDYFKRIYSKYCIGDDFINNALKIDFVSLLPDQVLSFVDILSMNSSLEIRPPFLDNDMIDLAFKIHGEKKIINSEPKVILKRSLEFILPDEVIYRKKEGFVLPIEDMYLKKNVSKIKKVLSKKNTDKHGYLKYSKINKLLTNINNNNFYDNNKIWIFYCFQKWWDLNF